jgi:hypothetical protein
MTAPPYPLFRPHPQKEPAPMAKPAKPIQVPFARSFTREDVQTALVLLAETKAAAKAAAPASPHLSRLEAPHTEREFTAALDVAHALAILARAIKRECEAACNGFSDGRGQWSETLEKASAKREERAKARAIALLDQNFPGLSLGMGGDPRGACFHIKTPHTQRHNTWGGAESGWAVV